MTITEPGRHPRTTQPLCSTLHSIRRARKTSISNLPKTAYLDAGALRKILLGVPLYARGWTGVVAGNRHGLYQTATGPAPAPGDELASDGVATLDFIAANQVGYITYLDPFSLVSLEYNPSTQAFWSYETKRATIQGDLYRHPRSRWTRWRIHLGGER
jgi:chitinase